MTQNDIAPSSSSSTSDRQDQTLGRGVDRAITEVRNEYSTICGLLGGIGWQALLADTSHPQSRPRARRLVANHLRDPRTVGNQVEPGTKTLATRFRESATRLERFYRVCAMSREITERFDDLATWRRDIAFFLEVRAWMVKYDAADREASGKSVAAEVNLYLSQLAASVVEAEEITDLYAEAGIGQLDLTQLNEEALRKLQTSETPHLAVEALRRLIEQKMREVTRHNIIRRDSFAERLENLMIRYMRQQLSSAEMIAELVTMAKEVSADARRGGALRPPTQPGVSGPSDAKPPREAHQPWSTTYSQARRPGSWCSGRIGGLTAAGQRCCHRQSALFPLKTAVCTYLSCGFALPTPTAPGQASRPWALPGQPWRLRTQRHRWFCDSWTRNPEVLLHGHLKADRPVMYDLTEVIELKATSEDSSVLDALLHAKAHRAPVRDYIPDRDDKGQPVNTGFATQNWQKVIRDRRRPGYFVRRHFEAMVFYYLAEELRTGDVAVIGSEEYADWSEQLLPWDQVEEKLPEYLVEVGLREPGDATPFDGRVFVAQLRKRLSEAAAKADGEYPENDELFIDPDSGVPKLKPRRAEKPRKSAQVLEQAIKERMPERSLLGIVARTAYWIEWWRRFGPASGNDPKLKDPFGRYVITTFVKGTNMTYAEAARHIAGVSAHELSVASRRHVIRRS